MNQCFSQWAVPHPWGNWEHPRRAVKGGNGAAEGKRSSWGVWPRRQVGAAVRKSLETTALNLSLSFSHFTHLYTGQWSSEQSPPHSSCGILKGQWQNSVCFSPSAASSYMMPQQIKFCASQHIRCSSSDCSCSASPSCVHFSSEISDHELMLFFFFVILTSDLKLLFHC